MIVCLCFFVFFFSSRRRHTSWPRDWSSDVCSSDLAVGIDRVDPRRGDRLAEDHEHGGEDHDRQQEIGERTGGHDGNPLADRLVKEAAPLLLGGHGRNGGLVGRAGGVLVAEELDVAAERNGGDLPARAMAVVEADELGAKADGEGQHLHAAPAGDQEVTELMKEDDDRENEQKGYDPTGQTRTPQPQTPKKIHLPRPYGIPTTRPLPA